MASPESREFRQMRHDVDDVYRLLTETQETVQSGREAIGAVWNGQRRHGTRLEEIQQALDLQNMRMQREQGQRLGRVEVGQREQGQRLGRVEERLDSVDGRLERLEGTQQEILTLLRGRSGA
jgi:hypothetical protein